MAIEIPSGAVEIQTGLWLYSYNKVLLGQERTLYELYSSEGYYFYDNTSVEEERIYWQYMSLGFDNDTSMYTSIPESELHGDANIANNPNKPEIA